MDREVPPVRIGVIGIRSKHLTFFRDGLTVCFPDRRHAITHVCGYDAPELLPDCGDLVICSTHEELIRSTDAVIIALRDGTQHATLAELCMAEKKPVFVDKPFTCANGDAERILRCAKRTGTPCTGGSTIRFTGLVRRLAGSLPARQTYTLSYQADVFSPFGGWYFYGSHLTDVCVTLFGTRWETVSASLAGDRLSAAVRYPDFQVLLCSDPAPQPFVLTADQRYILDDKGCYAAGMEHFCAVAEKKEAGQAEELVSSVRLLNGIFNSLRAGGQPCRG